MRTLTIFAILVLASTFSCFATSTVPFKASKITVDYGQGRKAIFTLDIPGLAHGKRRYQIPKVIGVEFVFANGKTAKIPKEGLAGIEIIDIHSTMIETGIGNGNWFLTTRIKNREALPRRIANDWVVFVFKNFKYEKRWLELNDKWNSAITKAEQDGADQPATAPDSNPEGKEKPKPESEVRPQ